MGSMLIDRDSESALVGYTARINRYEKLRQTAETIRGYRGVFMPGWRGAAMIELWPCALMEDYD